MAPVHTIEWTVVGELLCPLTSSSGASSGRISKTSIRVSIRGHGGAAVSMYLCGNSVKVVDFDFA